MSKGSIYGLSFITRIFGIILIFIGSVLAYYTYINQIHSGMSSFLFVFAGILLMTLGLLLVTVKIT